MNRPDFQPVARAHDFAAGDARAVEEGAVNAIEILDVQHAILKTEQAMAPAHFGRADAQIAIRAPADDGLLGLEAHGALAVCTFFDNQAHIHFLENPASRGLDRRSGSVLILSAAGRGSKSAPEVIKKRPGDSSPSRKKEVHGL